MEIQDLHSWDVSPSEARSLQEQLRPRLQLTDGVRLRDIRRVAGVDNSYIKSGSETVASAVVVVLSFPGLEMLETAFASRNVTFPYVPGLLTFREAPAVLAAFGKIAVEPDVVLFDSQGYAHFRRFGLASHLGVVLDRPTIGCAKTRLIGRYAEPLPEFGASTPLLDKEEQVGAAVRTRPGHAPLFVSPGNKISVPTAVEIVLACCRNNHFMPEPTHLAHQLVTSYARERRESPRSPTTR